MEMRIGPSFSNPYDPMIPRIKKSPGVYPKPKKEEQKEKNKKEEKKEKTFEEILREKMNEPTEGGSRH
jgi:hypothetical protein